MTLILDKNNGMIETDRDKRDVSVTEIEMCHEIKNLMVYFAFMKLNI